MLSRTLVATLRANPLGVSAVQTSRNLKRFNYPHSHAGANSSLTNIPQDDVYPRLKREGFEPGEKPELAHQNVRKFPDWYKPYGFNYMGDGWFLGLLSGMLVLGHFYMNDIREMKGRKTRKAYSLNSDRVKPWNENATDIWATRQLAKDDPNWTKFLPGKTHRASAHH